MENKSDNKTKILDNLIIGRVEPQIYAFSTETVPNYLKIGDTYRPIEMRLNEWRKYFPNLEKRFEDVAKVDNETFYRDYAIHLFLENELKKKRLGKNTFKSLPYFSNEFFNDTNVKDIKDAIMDINNSFQNRKNKYQFYKFDSSRVPLTHTYERSEKYKPRPNQQETINKFKIAIKNGRKNLLMYAVMRFGKSFTSMCCATEMDAKFVVIVTAKADVKEEWKKTVESHIRFDGYEFVDSNSLLQSDSIIKKKLKEGKRLLIFLTLQDLQGTEIKTKHKEIFVNKIDLLIIDETHFGARAFEYGKILEDINLSKNEIKSERKKWDDTLDTLEENTKVLRPKIKLHLSGTPYRILMGSEFTKDDIIAFYQFSDIANDQSKWDMENLYKDDTKEWDNPYYGFPQMIRFAFNPNESSRKKMEELKNNGITYAFSALLKPKSLTKDNTNNYHKKFIHEKEILDLFEIIDGSKNEENLLGFLDYKKIKDGKMCRHIVCVLPFRASCDALEQLIKSNSSKFKNLNSYEIINISGVDNDRAFKDTLAVKEKIKEFEAQNKKTITFTVNRMLTGSTVEEWDTMIYLKDTASPQEYDQAVFRLQNQYIRQYKEPNGDVVKFNMKPQTLLVDFDPNRMFSMQEQKSQIYNVNTDANGNNKLEDRIKRELEISPIVVFNKNRIVQVVPSDILDAVRQYSSERSVLDEALTIPVDFSLFNIVDIKNEIDKQGKIGSKQGLEIKANQGDGDELSDQGVDGGRGSENSSYSDSSAGNDSTEENEVAEFKSKFAMYYSKILFFAFLSDSKVKSLLDIINQVEIGNNNRRISASLDLNKNILSIIQNKLNSFILSKLDYKIQNINTLANDRTLEPIQRASNAMMKFSRLSVSEIVTPEHVTAQIIDLFPTKDVTTNTKILDIAAKQGEFVYGIYKKFGKRIADNFYSIPTSKIAYEFTRKVYSLLELDVCHIESNYTSYDLIKNKGLIKDKNIKIGDNYMKIDIILGNPPYQEMDGGASASAKPIYNNFVDIAKKLEPNYISMITPSRWFAGGKGLDEFRDSMINDSNISVLHDFLNPETIFPRTNIRGGICYFLWDKNYDNKKNLVKVVTHKDKSISSSMMRALKIDGIDTFIRHGSAISILEKLTPYLEKESFDKYVSSRKPFGLEGFYVNDENFKESKKGLKSPIVCYGKGKKIGYIERKEVLINNGWIDKYKVFTPYANNIGTELNDDNLNSFVGEPDTISTETYIVIGVELNLDYFSAKNITKYLTTKFLRFLHGLAKTSHHATSKTYKFVPLQDFGKTSDIDWSKSISEIDKQLYKKYKLTAEEIAFIESMIKPME